MITHPRQRTRLKPPSSRLWPDLADAAALPGVRPAPVNSPPDVVVRYGPVPPAPPTALAAGPLRQVTPGDARFGLPDVAWLLERGGNDILIARRGGGDDELHSTGAVGNPSGEVDGLSNMDRIYPV